MMHSTLSKLPIANKRVFLRADANVPIVDGAIQSDFRLQALKPTLNFLVQKNATVVFATHLGRPTKQEPALSTTQLVPWFEKNGYLVQFAKTLDDAHQLSIQNKPCIIILENLRFFPGEKSESHAFAQQLAQLAEFYVDDAFATLHRKDTSIYLLPQLFAPDKRTVGFLVESEITHLSTLLNKPRTGYTLMLGGGKVSTKIPLIQAFIPKVEHIILCPAIVFTFLRALGKETGKSLVDENEIQTCLQIIESARINNTKIVFPADYQVAHEIFDGPLSYTLGSSIPKNAVGVSVGKQSIHLFSEIIRNSTTIFYNGLMANLARPQSLETTQAVFNAIATSNGYSVIAGGDSIGFVERLDLASQINYLSTGGGATLAFLSGEPLPGLSVFSK